MKPYTVFLITFVLTALVCVLLATDWTYLTVLAGVVLGTWAGWLLDK